MSTNNGTAAIVGPNNGTSAADTSMKKSIFAKAGSYDNLTAFERTILKIIRYCLLAGLIAALPIISQAIATQSVDWSLVLKTAAATFGSAALLALVKYLTARNQVQIADKPAAVGRTAGPTQPKAAITN